MASREFLKILNSARLGDVSAQQKLANAYLTGAFKTPIQPANALIWLEKSYFSYINQGLENINLTTPEALQLLEQITNIPLGETLNSPAFGFAWDALWKLAQSDLSPKTQAAAQWQLVDLLINPLNQDTQLHLADWLKKKTDSHSSLQSAPLDFPQLQELAKQYLQSLTEGNTSFAKYAKELLIKLQPKNEVLSSLWNSWLEDQNENALIQAAELGLTVAKRAVGLRLAQLDSVDATPETKSNASLKKAAYWLELAAKDGDRDAWYALGEIYRRPQFSGYSATESDRCFDHAADLGHPQAQLRKGAKLWRKREKIAEKVRGLQASYWVWQAHQQGVPEATELLSKILESRPHHRVNEWYALAQYAKQAINHHAEHKLDEDWLLLCHRIIIANQFNFTKAELLLCELDQLQHEHCVVVDIRWELPKILPRLIQIETIEQRRALLAGAKVFAGTKLDAEGNLRQRRYRFDRVCEWLTTSISKRIRDQTEAELA